MLTFFRKYQRFFFILTTVMVVASFSFFGTFGSMDSTSKVKEEPLFKAVNGSMITKQRAERMVQFISFSHFDFLDDKVTSPNWLNDGVLEKDFLKTPLGLLLAERIFSEMSDELSFVLRKAQSFQSYRHPGAPFLSAESIWAQFVPESVRLSSELTKRSEVTPKTFELLSRFYLGQKSFPSVFLKRVMLYQESQDSRIQPDSSLSYADVSLVGLHSAKDWFGPTYLRAVAQVILNASDYAQSLGLKVSIPEVREQLLANLQEAAKKVSKDFDPKDTYALFLGQVRKMGMEESECLSLWQDIALFRKLIQSSANAAVVDPVVLKDLYDSAKELATVEVFSLPAHLELKDFSSLLKLQMYLNAVSSLKTRGGILSFPKELLSLAEIEKKTPELVQRDYVLEYAEVDLKKVASHVGLKETWAWQTGDVGFSLIRKQFPFLAKKEISTKEERFSVLEGLDAKQRLEIDRFAREKILSSDLTRLKNILLSSEKGRDSFSIGSKGEGLPFKELKDKVALVALLERSAYKAEESDESSALASKELLTFYTDDQQHYYFIQVLERSPVKRVLSFAESNSSGVLRQILDKKLEAIYPDIRKKDTRSYMQNGAWKPLAQVKDKVGMALFPEVLKEIQSEYLSFYGKEPTAEQKKSPAFYVQNRMLAPLREALEKAKAADGTFVLSDLDSKEWELVKQTQTFPKGSEEIFSEASLFYLPEGAFSPVTLQASGKGWFFRLVNRSDEGKPSSEDIEAVTAPFKIDAERQMGLRLLNAIEEKKALFLKVANED